MMLGRIESSQIHYFIGPNSREVGPFGPFTLPIKTL